MFTSPLKDVDVVVVVVVVVDEDGLDRRCTSLLLWLPTRCWFANVPTLLKLITGLEYSSFGAVVAGDVDRAKFLDVDDVDDSMDGNGSKSLSRRGCCGTSYCGGGVKELCSGDEAYGYR